MGYYGQTLRRFGVMIQDNMPGTVLCRRVAAEPSALDMYLFGVRWRVDDFDVTDILAIFCRGLNYCPILCLVGIRCLSRQNTVPYRNAPVRYGCTVTVIRLRQSWKMPSQDEAFYDGASPYPFWGSSLEEPHIWPENWLEQKSNCIAANNSMARVYKTLFFEIKIGVKEPRLSEKK